jgi:hypothetical protein
MSESHFFPFSSTIQSLPLLLMLRVYHGEFFNIIFHGEKSEQPVDE